ncbi:hypothetical protein G7Z17_g9225 [Cylindrodendrum hubeiense]|uniref:Arylamine N-acetyltransferase n=1 Tax=Cylindrodendrum hubeiense TaxID=595255 RepID=A0A9P5H3R3_9HYPO|nr:hypothetical protein G7Z17_g9225 [Cylindrodendrum hubeiense]
MAPRVRYRRSQLEPYFARIRVPVTERPGNVEGLSPEKQLEILTLLHKCHLCNIPFENLSMHYSWHRIIDVDPQHLFNKIILQPGRGGYCMENNSLFYTLLGTLGFDVYMAGARMFQPELGKYNGFNHCVIIVNIGNQPYMVDVGFGANGPLAPLKMDAEANQVLKHVGPMSIRLRYDAIPQGFNRRGKFWIYQHRLNPEADWAPLYCFTDFEFLPEDIRHINLAPSTAPTSVFVQKVVCTRFTTDNDFKIVNGKIEVQTRWDTDDAAMNGALILFGSTLKLRTEGVTVYQTELESETERLKALQKYFLIKLPEQDRNAIRGSATEIHESEILVHWASYFLTRRMTEAPSFEKDSQVTRLDEATFAADLTKAFCVGTVPNGGYVASVFLRVASVYLSQRNQPDPIAASWQFLNATHEGPAILVVEDVKPGRGISVIHVTLYQGGLLSQSPWVSPQSKKRAVAYITSSQLAGEKGITLPTGFDVKDSPPPVDLEQLTKSSDANWERLYLPIMDYVPILNNLEFYAPKDCKFRPATYDFWIRMANVEGFTNASLGYISDAGPPLIVETFRPSGPDSEVPEGGFAFDKMFWYPTVSMSLEVKKALAAEGEEWLRLRVAAKVLKNGRYDAEVIVFDRNGEVVALSNHVALAVDIERNISRKGRL